MRIENIEINNFRQFYGFNEITFVPSERNITLISGKNGYGKTNMLIALVWCLYGDRIDRVDKIFKSEIQKAGTYGKFLKNSLNWKSEHEGNKEFSVRITFSELDLPEKYNTRGRKIKCNIYRSFDLDKMNDYLNIDIDGTNIKGLIEEEDKINFINDYLVPLEAAKFIFFDAEKISEMANLSVKDEGHIMNDALSKMLGLDLYENLLYDLRNYSDNLKLDSAERNIKDQITATENLIKLNNNQIDQIEILLSQNSEQINECKLRIQEYESILVKNNHIAQPDMNELKREKDEIEIKIVELRNIFLESSESIPFAMMAGTIEDVLIHLEKQKELTLKTSGKVEIDNKSETLIEELFNKPPFPIGGDILFQQKVFYAEKAKKLFNSLFDTNGNEYNINFEHDLSPHEMDLIFKIFENIKTNSNNTFEKVATQLNKNKLELMELNKVIRFYEAESTNELFIEYANKKEETTIRYEKLLEEKGSHLQKINELRKENERLNMNYQLFLKKIEISDQKRKKYERVTAYIKIIEEFINIQKQKKRKSLGNNILTELKKLMHKLQDNSEQMIEEVKVEILPERDGLNITLFDSNGDIKPKETLSQGEKQIYISALIKALLLESVQEYPIIIDTPLARLDDSHIKNVLLYYYPDLSKQVILMATNNEISNQRYKIIKDYISETFVLESCGNVSQIVKGATNFNEN